MLFPFFVLLSIFLTSFPLPHIQLVCGETLWAPSSDSPFPSFHFPRLLPSPPNPVGVWKSAVGSLSAGCGAKPGRERIFVFFRLGNRGRKQRFPVRLTSTATARLSASRLHLAQAFRRAPTFMGCTQQASKVVGSGLTIPPPRKLTPRIEYVYHIWRYFEWKRCRQTATSSTESSRPHV